MQCHVSPGEQGWQSELNYSHYVTTATSHSSVIWKMGMYKQSLHSDTVSIQLSSLPKHAMPIT